MDFLLAERIQVTLLLASHRHTTWRMDLDHGLGPDGEGWHVEAKRGGVINLRRWKIGCGTISRTESVMDISGNTMLARSVFLSTALQTGETLLQLCWCLRWWWSEIGNFMKGWFTVVFFFWGCKWVFLSVRWLKMQFLFARIQIKVMWLSCKPKICLL